MLAKTKTKGKTRQSLKFQNKQSPKGGNLNDSFINTVQQLHNHLSVSIIKYQKGN